MDLNVESISDTRKKAVLSLSEDDLRSEERSILKEFSQHAKIPGFRPGKAPEAMLRKKYRKEIREELNRKLLRKGYEQVQEEGGLVILNVVDIKDPELDSDGPSEIVLTLDVKPPFTVPEYKGLPLDRDDTAVAESEIDEAIETMRTQRAEFNKVERAAAKGDYVRCSYSGSINGEAIAEEVKDRPVYGTQNNTWEEAGAEDAPGIPEIAAALVGMSPGDKTTVEVNFSEDHPLEFLKGKAVSYELEVSEVRERALPEIDEAFLKSVQAESLENLREQMAESIKGQKEQESERKVRQQATEKILASVDFELPESLVQAESNQILTSFMQRQMQSGATEEDFEKNRESLLAGAEEQARNRVKMNLILDEIAKEEKVTVEEDDISQFIYSFAMQSRRSPDDIVKELRKDQSRVAEIQQNIRRSKTVAKIVELGAIEEPKSPSEAKA